MSWVKTVIHVHTNYSFDANASPADVIATARLQGVGCVAITDHDEIDGALEAQDLADNVQVVVGEEVSSADGHIIGLFLSERIEPGLPAEVTAERIKEQGGLVLAPHPFTVLCNDSLHSSMDRLVPWLDAVEICNAQDLLPWENTTARRFAERHGIVPYVGADSHIRGYLAAAYQEMPPFDGPRGFLAALEQARLFPGRFGVGYFAAMGVRHVWDKIFSYPLPGFAANASSGNRPVFAR